MPLTLISKSETLILKEDLHETPFFLLSSVMVSLNWF